MTWRVRGPTSDAQTGSASGVGLGLLVAVPLRDAAGLGGVSRLGGASGLGGDDGALHAAARTTRHTTRAITRDRTDSTL